MNRPRTISPIRTATAAAMTLGAALVLTACGDGGSTSEASNAGANAAAESGADLAVNEDSPLGPVVVDSEGFTLYRFDNDTKEPPTTNCAADCLVKWPAAVAPDDIELDGIDEGIVGTLTRDDGTKQVTLDGWALYRFAADAQPGDTKGQGVGEVWWAVTPDGEKAKAVSSSTGGYDY
jgi:predicted lipoprotein with Yx(FWY)xxD motif